MASGIDAQGPDLAYGLDAGVGPFPVAVATLPFARGMATRRLRRA